VGPGEILAFLCFFTFQRAAGEERCGREFISDEGLLAGGDFIAGGCTPAKPRWLKVIIFWDVFLRQKCSSPEENVKSGWKKPHRRRIARSDAHLR